MNQKGRVRIIPVDSGMGFEDWDSKYKGQGRPQLTDFLDDEESSVILRLGRPYPEPSHRSVHQNTQTSGFLPPTYPEGYDTIDRRRKRKVREPGGLFITEAGKMGEESFSSDLALLRDKRGELFLQQVAEMQEAEECMTPCLRPYQNGLLYKTRMWAKTELDNTVENYVAYKKAQDARMRTKFDFDQRCTGSQQHSMRGEEDMDDLAFIPEDLLPDTQRHFQDMFCEGHMDRCQGFREKKCGKAKIGGWVPEAMLSPVEEPSDEYVDPMDELQCLVETVSEYLAEKEEEISKYGSLPKSSKSRLSSLGSIRTDSTGEDPNNPKESKGDHPSCTTSDQGISGVKNAMTSLFSNLTDRVGGAPKQPTQCAQAPPAQPPQSGLKKLFSFIPKSNSSAPVAVVSPVEPSPENYFASLPSQPPCDAITQGRNRETRATTVTLTQTTTKAHEPEVQTKPHTAPGNSFLGKLNPLKLFSTEDNMNTSECKEPPNPTNVRDHTKNETDFHPGKLYTTPNGGKKSDKVGAPPRDKHPRHTLDENINVKQHSRVYSQEAVPSAGPIGSTGVTQSGSTGFFSPFKKSLSSLITPAAPIIPHGAPPVVVYPVFRSSEDPGLEKQVEDPVNSKIKPSHPHSQNVSTPPRPKAEGGLLSGFLKFASSDDVSASPNSQRYSQSYPDPATSAPPGSNQNITSNQHLQNSKVPSNSHLQHTSNPKAAAAPHGMRSQAPNQPESLGFLTGIFKGGSADNISHIDSNPPKQGGLLSGLLKFGSAGDIPESSPQQAALSNQPSRSMKSPELPHHSPQQQNPTATQRGGLLSGLLKFSSTENQNVHVSEARNPRDIPDDCHYQHESSDEQTQPQQMGLLSGLLKFASSENISSHHQQHQQQDFRPSNTQRPTHTPLSRNQTSVHPVKDQETTKPGFTRQQTVPLQQPPAQRGSLLSGLFKFASADNINSQQQPSAQQHGVVPSKSSHEQAGATPVSKQNPQQNRFSEKTVHTSRPVSRWTTTENMSHKQQPQVTPETQTFIRAQCGQAGPPREDPTSQSGGLSGLFNKLTKSPEKHNTTCQTTTGQQLRQANNDMVQMSRPLQTQSHSDVTEQSQKDCTEKDKRMPQQTAQQGFLSGLFSKRVTEESCTSAMAEQNTPSSELRQLHSSGITKLGNDTSQNIVSGSNPGQSRHAIIQGPVSIDAESLDLRTSATFARALHNPATYSSISVGNLSQLYHSGYTTLVHPTAFSTGNIHGLFQNHTHSSVMAMDPYIGGSTPSLCGTSQNLYRGQMSPQLSPYGISPSYDENQWIRGSAIWQQFQNESLNYQFQEEDQGYIQNSQGTSPQASLCYSPTNISQTLNSSLPWHGMTCQQEPVRPHQFVGDRIDDAKRKLWNSYEDLANREYVWHDDGALNLTTKQPNSKMGNQAYNDGSTYSLNGVSYHEGYYEETAPSLSYSANWQYGMDRSLPQNSQNNSLWQQGHFNINQPQYPICPPTANPEMEDSVYLEDTEWYQQWLTLLEQGMWWPAEDGDCGYFVYTDHEYIYALLTDAAGEYVYACAPENESLENTQTFGSFPSALLCNEMVMVCGFKIPLYNEDELLWLPGQEHSDCQLLNGPLDLSAAYRKGNQIMNLNLEQFSEMFENSFLTQMQQGLDFTSYRLNKVRMDQSYISEDQSKYVMDLSCHNKQYTGPQWNNQETKTFLAQKVAVSLNSTPTTNGNQQVLYNCYHPGQRRRSSTAVTVKHVDDVSEEDWRKRVTPGEEQPNRQVKTISSLISSFVSKTSQAESVKPNLSPSHQKTLDDAPDKQSKNVFSSGFHSLKSKIIKDESPGVASKPESVQQPVHEKSVSRQRILPSTPTATQVTQPPTQPPTISQKPRLSRQTTVVQHVTQPTQSSVTAPLRSKESLDKPEPPESKKPVTAPPERPSEQTQPGFMSFLKTAVGIDEPKQEPQKYSQTPLNQQSKTGSTASLPGNTTTNKEATGVSNIFGSFTSLFNEPPPPQKTQMKHNRSESSLASAAGPKGVERQHTLTKSVTSEPGQTQPSVSPTEQAKQGTGSKPSGGLFGFSLGEMLAGSTAVPETGAKTPASSAAPQEESLGKSILSIFSGPQPTQTGPKTESLHQTQPPNASPQPPLQESLGKGLLSIIGGGSPSQPPSHSKPSAEPPQQKAIPSKDQQSPGFLSMFGSPSTQQSQSQTGSILGGILSGSTSSTENPVKGLLSMFSDPSPSQPQPSTPSSQQLKEVQSQTQGHGAAETQSKSQPQPQAQQAPSVLGGLFGGLSVSSDSPRKSLFSMFSGPSTSQTTGAEGSTNMSITPGSAAPKEPSKSAPSVLRESKLSTQATPASSAAMAAASKQLPDPPLQLNSSQVSSVSSSRINTTVTTTELANEAKDVPPADVSANDAANDNVATIKGIDNSSTEQNSECTAVLSEIRRDALQDPATSKQTPASGLLSMISGSSQQTPSSQAGFLSDSPGKGLLSLFSGPNNDSNVGQTSPSHAGTAAGSTGPKEPLSKSLLSVFGSSTPEPNSQSGISLLGTVFGGSSPQKTASHPGGSLLGGLFGGSAPQPASQTGQTKSGGAVPHTAGPQSGSSFLGGLFGSTPEVPGSQPGGSILGGIFGGSATSTTVSHGSGTLGGIFSGPGTQTTTPQTGSSILGGILGISSSQTATPQTGASPGNDPVASAPKEIPCKGPSGTPATLNANDDNTLSSIVPSDASSDVSVKPKHSDDSKPVPAQSNQETCIPGVSSKSKDESDSQQQPDTTGKCREENLGVQSQVVGMSTTEVDKVQCQETEISILAKEPARPEVATCQSGADSAPLEKGEETKATQPSTPVVQGQQKPPESDKSVGDSSTDAITGFMSSLFKPMAAPSEGPQQQQKNFKEGVPPQVPSGQTGASLLGGLFGGSNSQTAAPQTGGLLGGLFKGPDLQSGTAPTTGGSILGGMFGGGSTTKPVGPQTGGSLLGGMFGGSATTAQPAGSLLGGMFGGATAQSAGSQTGASILGGIGGSLFGGMGQPPKCTEPVPAESKSKPNITQLQQVKSENVPQEVSACGPETHSNKVVDSSPADITPVNALKMNNEAAAEAASPETTAITCPSVNTTCEPTNQESKCELEKPGVLGQEIQELTGILKEEPGSTDKDKSVHPDVQKADSNIVPSGDELSNNAEAPQAKSLFGFISAPSDAGKSLGSLFSPTVPSGGASLPQTEAGSSLFSGLKTLSGGLFQEEKSGKQEPLTTSLFGTKLSFPWQTEPPKQQTAQVITSQPKTNIKPTGCQTQTSQNVTSDGKKTESVGSKDDVANPHICISTPEVDPSASLTPQEKEGLVESNPSAGATSGVQLDNQSKKDLLNAKRLVKA